MRRSDHRRKRLRRPGGIDFRRSLPPASSAAVHKGEERLLSYNHDFPN